MARVLRPGGTAVFLEPLGHNPIINLYRRITPAVRTPDEHPLLMKDLKVAAQYFNKVEAQFFNLTTFLAVPFRKWSVFKPLVGALDLCDRALFTVVPFAKRYAWQMVLKLSEPRKG
jgi:hypothetical protein